MSSSVGHLDEKLEKLRGDIRRGKWPEVFETYKQERALRTAEITAMGDTMLHMAVCEEEEKVVAKVVDFLVLEEQVRAQNDVVVTVNGDGEGSQNMNVILGAKNGRNNTPLHLAATMGNVKMCKKMGGVDVEPSSIARRNVDGETPLFLAALNGKKEAFLWLHYQHMRSSGVSSTNIAHCIRDNNDTILHCAIAEGHIDVAIEIVHLYKDHLKEMMGRNKEGLSPLHLLAAKRSAFKSTALLERSIFVRPIYWVLRVKKKKQATTMEELEKRERQLRVGDLLRASVNKFVRRFLRVKKNKRAMTREALERRERQPWYALLDYAENRHDDDDDDEERSLVAMIGDILVYLLVILTLIPLAPLMISEDLFLLAERWLHQIRKMKEKHTWSLQIMNELLQHASKEDMSQIISRTNSEQLSILQQPEQSYERESMAMPPSGTITIETPLMIAVKNGVVEMVKRILKFFPSCIKDVNIKGKNVVMLAAEYRQTEVFWFLCKQKRLSESLFWQVDKEENNALHLAARLGVEADWLNPGEEFYIMSREINWFKFVKDSMPHDLLKRYNRKMETPDDIFKESHKELMKSERKWATKTSLACFMASTLVASAAFTTCTNVPGGYDNEGYPIHRNKPGFQDFRDSSFKALYFSLISTISFLSIVASPSQYVHTWRDIPSKLHCGMFFMFYSIVLMWISFCAGYFVMLDKDNQTLHLVFLKYFVHSLGIVLLVIMQFPTFSVLELIPGPRRKATRPIEYRRTRNEENDTDI
ncbi:uncharacterized protein LOC114712984 [Neltuma alba]|uniref:uncharacterized protein LOC114712984 n=1 Tax=Neltuma alba TaxID=207710 RepID=UPI0010A57F0D|nr:uncharacterized protein LOC114712984 [Prosopis alba]